MTQGSRLKDRVHALLEPAQADDRASKLVDAVLIVLVLANVVAVILESMPSIPSSLHPLFLGFELLSIAVFSIEYVLRLWSCTSEDSYRHPIIGRLRFALSPLTIVDLVAILPFYLGMLGMDLRFLRMLRIFRIAKLARYSTAVQTFDRVLVLKRGELLITLLLLFVLLVIASSVMYFAEHEAQPEQFSSIPAAMWWAVATLTTVGYGDVLPITTLGKIMASVIAVLGIGIFGLPAGILGSGFVEEMRERKKREAHPCCPHCGKELPSHFDD